MNIGVALSASIRSSSGSALMSVSSVCVMRLSKVSSLPTR